MEKFGFFSELISFCFTLYAGVLIYYVPSFYCQKAPIQQLTFEAIFNDTNYAQIGYRPRMRPIDHSLVKNRSMIDYTKIDYENQINDIDKDVNRDNSLLVGFTHAPFRNSVPNVDYVKGVRNTEPDMANRGKRGVVHLYNMIHCATGCDPISYKGYGCYCGFLGAGRSMDGIDRCCKYHDKCYENIYCPFFTVYFQPYYWKCYHGEPLCALENHETRNHLVNSCAAKLCECDRKFAMCLQRYRCPRGRALCTSSPLRLFQNLIMIP